MLYRVILAIIYAAIVAAMPASVNVVANVRGKKYDISAETVEEFSQQVETLAGIEASQQSVLFRGKVLEPSESLEELGVAEGDVLNVLKGRKPRAAKPQESLDLSDLGDSSEFGGGMPSGFGGMGSLDGYDPEEALKNMDPEQMKKTMEAMDNLLDSDFIEEYFGDDERLEKARQQMLENMDQYEKMMPGFKEQAGAIAQDPQQWRDAMQKAKEQILTMKAQRDSMREGNNPPAADNGSVDDIGDE